MHCPFCAHEITRVVDTDKEEMYRCVHRRRQCSACLKRFSTVERVYLGNPMIVKTNGSREEFNREKMLRGIKVSCTKLPVETSKIENLVDEIERTLQLSGRTEVPSREIGDMVINGLKTLNYVAYIRYAIVYLHLTDLTSVRQEIDRLLNEMPK